MDDEFVIERTISVSRPNRTLGDHQSLYDRFIERFGVWIIAAFWIPVLIGILWLIVTENIAKKTEKKVEVTNTRRISYSASHHCFESPSAVSRK